MKKILLKFNKNAIMEEVGMTSAYLGAKSGEEEGKSFLKIATIEADRDLLDRFWVEMTGRIADKLKNVIKSNSLSETDFEMELEVSGAYDESLTPSVERDLYASLVAWVTARWLRYTFPDRANEWEAEANSLLERAFCKLCYRKKPIKHQS